MVVAMCRYGLGNLCFCCVYGDTEAQICTCGCADVDDVVVVYVLM